MHRLLRMDATRYSSLWIEMKVTGQTGSHNLLSIFMFKLNTRKINWRSVKFEPTTISPTIQVAFIRRQSIHARITTSNK
jgi:hypothetical protein